MDWACDQEAVMASSDMPSPAQLKKKADAS